MERRQHIDLEFAQPDVAVLTFGDPDKRANAFSAELLDVLQRHLDELDSRRDLVGVVVKSSVEGVFSVGADLRQFVAAIDSPAETVRSICQRGQQLFRRLSRSNYVSVAVIDGICMGGGAELAVWCDYRIFSRGSQVRFGFPEVKVGVLPGWGGGVRTARLLGLSNAVELVTGGEPIDTPAAQSLGLATDVVASDDLLPAAIRMIRSSAESAALDSARKRLEQPIHISDAELGFLGATASAFIQQQTKGHYPAPIAALEALLGGAGVDVAAACELEADAFAALFGTAENRALLNVFFLQDANKRHTGVTEKVTPRPVRHVSVIGAGLMGQGVTAANVKRGIPVTMTDLDTEGLARGVEAALREVAYDKRTKMADAQRAVEFAPLINATTTDDEVAAADLVLEAIVEKLAAKKALFARLESQLQADTILCSNTSTIPISALAADLQRPENFCGLHFFNPVRRMPLVEVIRGEKTSDETIATAVAYAKQLGKSPIVMKDGPGFVVNRLLFPYLTEAVHLLIEGASIRSVDRAAVGFGMPMGPITLCDTIGLDTAMHAGNVLVSAFPDRVQPPAILSDLVAEGRLGQKVGRGFFDYPSAGTKTSSSRQRGMESPEVAAVIERHRTEQRKIPHDELSDRLFLSMLLEATRVLEEGIVATAQDVDLALIFGTGFPPFRGGLCFWADQIGADKLLERLAQYDSLGRRFQPTAMLREAASQGKTLYEIASQ